MIFLFLSLKPTSVSVCILLPCDCGVISGHSSHLVQTLKWTGMTCSYTVCVYVTSLHLTVPSKKKNVLNCSYASDLIKLQVLDVFFSGVFFIFQFFQTFILLIKFCPWCCFADICKKPGECWQVRTLPGRSQQQRTVLWPFRYWGRERRQTCL